MWQAIEPDADFDVYYEKSFDLRDKHSDLQLYAKAIETVPHDAFVHAIHREIAAMMIEDESELQEVLDAIAEDHANMNIVVPGEN
jgi:hemoglobin-like flavoprotein